MMFLTAYGALIFDAQAKQGRLRHHSRSFEQRRLGSDSTREFTLVRPYRLTRTSEKKSKLLRLGPRMSLQTQEARTMVAEVMAHHECNGARVASIPWAARDFPKLISALAIRASLISRRMSEGRHPDRLWK